MTSEQVRELLFEGGSTEVEPARIGPVLQQAWRKKREENPKEAMMRVCTQNLLLVCSSPQLAVGLSHHLRELVTLYPGRVLVVVLDETSEGPTRAWFHIECCKDRPNKLSGEVIVLHAPGQQAGSSLHSLLTPAWQDGVPLFLWWLGQPPYDSGWFETLVETSTRVILDTGGFRLSSASPEEAAQLLQGLSRFVYDRYHQDQTFSDLTWGRLLLWREWIATMFDPLEHRELLGRLSVFRLDCWAAEGQPTISLLSLYIAGWMIHLLKWRVTQPLRREGDEFVAHLEANGHPFELRLISRPCEVEDLERRLVAVCFEGYDANEKPFSLSIERSLDELFTLTRTCTVADHDCTPHAMQHARLTVKELVGQQLESFAHDRVFEGALGATLELTGALIPPVGNRAGKMRASRV